MGQPLHTPVQWGPAPVDPTTYTGGRRGHPAHHPSLRVFPEMTPSVSANQPNPAATHRQHTRVPVSLPAQIFELDDQDEFGEPQSAEIFDLSRGGLGLHCRRLIHARRRLAILLRKADGSAKLLFGIVRNVEYIGSGLHKLGIEFLPVPTSPPVQRFISQHGL
jgi:hypothetical protein